MRISGHRLGAAFALIALVTACASQPTRPSATVGPASGLMVQDGTYMAAVERKARRNGLQIQWINPPQRRVAPATEQ